MEAERQRIVENHKQNATEGTPVTEESFQSWQEERNRKRGKNPIPRNEPTEPKNIQGGKEAAVLSGRDLFHFNQDLFFDDNDDDDTDK